MRIVVKKPGKEPEVKEIPNKLEAFQKIVGGYIETILITDDPILCVCNEEGKMLDLEPNFMFGGDVIVGDVFFVGTNEFDFESLTDEQVDMVMTVLNLFGLHKIE